MLEPVKTVSLTLDEKHLFVSSVLVVPYYIVLICHDVRIVVGRFLEIIRRGSCEKFKLDDSLGPRSLCLEICKHGRQTQIEKSVTSQDDEVLLEQSHTLDLSHPISKRRALKLTENPTSAL